MPVQANASIEQQLSDLIKRDFRAHFDQLQAGFASEPKWLRMRQTGTRLWLDSGSIEDIERVWTREFTAVTVNNTLLNKEIQQGLYDSFIPDTAHVLEHGELSERQKILEISFALNARHGLRLVEKFDAHVSLEEHTDLAYDVEQAVSYARRMYNICPERFYIKIPFTAAGLLATRRLSSEGIPINHTLGFSARQNYIIARIARPMFVNVFLGRLNSFVSENGLGSGDYVGEKATIASQRAIRELRAKRAAESLQIGASFRDGGQVYDLAGLDVLTIPPKVAGEFFGSEIDIGTIVDRTTCEYSAGINESDDAQSCGFGTLWDINDELVRCADELEHENIDTFTPEDLVDFFKEHGCGDVLVPWSASQMEASFREGKIPRPDNWKQALGSGEVGLDSLMNLAGLSSFRKDQDAMDEHVREVLRNRKK